MSDAVTYMNAAADSGNNRWDEQNSAATHQKGRNIGAGTMGGGIAMNFATAGIPVTIVETRQEALTHGLGVVRKIINDLLTAALAQVKSMHEWRASRVPMKIWLIATWLSRLYSGIWN